MDCRSPCPGCSKWLCFHQARLVVDTIPDSLAIPVIDSSEDTASNPLTETINTMPPPSLPRTRRRTRSRNPQTKRAAPDMRARPWQFDERSNPGIYVHLDWHSSRPLTEKHMTVDGRRYKRNPGKRMKKKDLSVPPETLPILTTTPENPPVIEYEEHRIDYVVSEESGVTRGEDTTTKSKFVPYQHAFPYASVTPSPLRVPVDFGQFKLPSPMPSFSTESPMNPRASTPDILERMFGAAPST